MIVHRLKVKTCKVLEVYWIFVGFNKILRVIFLWVTLYIEYVLLTLQHSTAYCY